MADTEEEVKKGSVRSFAPGTFEKTRRNIGPLDEDEAKEMAQKIGDSTGTFCTSRSCNFTKTQTK